MIKNPRHTKCLKKVKTKLEKHAIRVPCKRQSAVNSGAWLQRFDDVTGVDKGCVAKGINGKKQRKNILLLQTNMCLPKHLMHVCLKILYIHNF